MSATKCTDKNYCHFQQSGHVGFDKGAHLLGMTVRHVPMDPVTMQPDLRKFEAAIDSNTVMVIKELIEFYYCSNY